MATAQGTGSALAFRKEQRTATISNKALTSNVATLTTSAAHNFAVGDVVIVTGVDATFNGTFTIASTPSSTTFTYAKTASDVASASATGSATAGVYGTFLTAAVSNKALTTNVATLTTAAAHGFTTGQTVVVTGVDATFNGTFTIASVPSTTTFTYAKTASNVSSTASAGTAVAGAHLVANRAIPFQGETLTKPPAIVETPTLQGGTIVDTSSSYRFGVGAGGGDTNMYLFASGAAFLWELMLGSLVTTGSGPYTHTATPASSLPSASIDVNIGGTTASDILNQFDGAKVDSWQLKAAVDAPVTLGLTWVYANEAETTGTYGGTLGSNMRPFVWHEVGLGGAGAPVGCIQSITIDGNNNLVKEQKCLGSTTIAEPVRNGNAQFTGSMEVRLVAGSTANYSVFRAGAEVALVVTMRSGVTTDGSSGPATCTITMNVRLEGTTPTVPDAGVITVSIPFKAIAAPTNASAITVAVVNGDAVA